MKPSLIKLQKFFRLEAERGYDNHAVVGGLNRILDHWQGEARADALPEELIQMVVARLGDYPRLAPASRAEVLEGVWRRIQRSEDPEGAETALLPKTEKPRPEEARAETRSEARPDARPDARTEPRSEPRPPAPTPVSEKKERREKAAAPPPARQNAPQKPPARADKGPRRSAPGEPARMDDADYDEDFDGLPEEEEAAPARPLVDPQPPTEPAALDAPITVLPGIGPRHAQTLARLGLYVLRDLLYYLPRRYDDYSQLKPINRLWYGEEVTVIGTVTNSTTRPLKGGRMQVTEVVVSDGTGALRVSWFNQPWVAKRLRAGIQIVLSGKIDQYLGRLVMSNPEWEPLEQQQLSTNRIVPVYSLTAQITQRWLRRLLHTVLSYWAARVIDPLPVELRRSAGLMHLSNALYQAHFPDSWDTLNAARHRLAFDEIFLLQFGVLGQKSAWQNRPGRVFETPVEWLQERVSALPFELTGAQLRALEDVRQDMERGRPMNRLLQGDVGSGKTIVAALAAEMVVRHRVQAAIMAPTSILAEQHYKTLLNLLSSEDDPTRLQATEIRLMVGSTPEAEKREIRAGLEEGRVRLVIGTHALIEDPVTFADLGLVVVDEQHRFGVDQRSALRSKGNNPHLLVMTATPIPRSLALTIYGDLDLSVIDEMPPGRQPVSTHVLPPRERERAYSLIRSQIQAGQQAFIIYPLVEESDKSDSKAAVEDHQRLQKEIFPQYSLGLLHGRMKPDEKDQVMERFRDRQHQILVSTSVVEVGVDVPNATVMLIEGANRFGLAQLHQFRGRVGRGGEKSYCLLVPEDPDAMENERLQAMVETNDGFVLAQRDLDQRGPGQFLGTRQSGYSELQLASLTDLPLIENARRHAQTLFDLDPALERAEHRSLLSALDRFWKNKGGDIS